MNIYTKGLAPLGAMVRTGAKLGACAVGAGVCYVLAVYAFLLLVMPDSRLYTIRDFIETYAIAKVIVVVAFYPLWMVLGVSGDAALVIAIRASLILAVWPAMEGWGYCWGIVSAWWAARKSSEPVENDEKETVLHVVKGG